MAYSGILLAKSSGWTMYPAVEQKISQNFSNWLFSWLFRNWIWSWSLKGGRYVHASVCVCAHVCMGVRAGGEGTCLKLMNVGREPDPHRVDLLRRFLPLWRFPLQQHTQRFPRDPSCGGWKVFLVALGLVSLNSSLGLCFPWLIMSQWPCWPCTT